MWVSILNGNTVYTLRVMNYEDFHLIEHDGDYTMGLLRFVWKFTPPEWLLYIDLTHHCQWLMWKWAFGCCSGEEINLFVW